MQLPAASPSRDLLKSLSFALGELAHAQRDACSVHVEVYNLYAPSSYSTFCLYLRSVCSAPLELSGHGYPLVRSVSTVGKKASSKQCSFGRFNKQIHGLQCRLPSELVVQTAM